MRQGQFWAEFSLYLRFYYFPLFFEFLSILMNMKLDNNKSDYKTNPSDESTTS